MLPDHKTRVFVFEVANNHAGDVVHRLRMSDASHDVDQHLDFRFALRFLCRNPEAVIHHPLWGRTNIGFDKRFLGTRLPQDDQQAQLVHPTADAVRRGQRRRRDA